MMSLCLAFRINVVGINGQSRTRLFFSKLESGKIARARWFLEAKNENGRWQ